MGHRINEWIQRLVGPCLVVAALILRHFEVGPWPILAILLPVFCVLMLLTIAVDPGPRAKAFVEHLTSYFRP
jgi:hypothetical protein